MSRESAFPKTTKNFGRPFLKMQGLGNHFVLIDARHEDFPLTTDLIIRLCDPKIGVGGEQILILEPVSKDEQAQGADVFMRIWNIDGSEVGACGNATRCVGRILLEETGKGEVGIMTRAGVLKCKRHTLGIKTDMQQIKRDWQTVPLSIEVDTDHISLDIPGFPVFDAVASFIGNPHVVFFVDDITSIDMVEIGLAVQKNPLFPESVNVGVAQIIEDDTLVSSVFERPGILTSACGTGACTAAAAARRRGLISADKVRVKMAGGDVEIQLLENDYVTMSGAAEITFAGFLPIDLTGDNQRV